MKKTIGIIGGMGPLATCDLMQKIISCCGAHRDQDYPHIYVDCNTDIPDRTEAILHQGPSPVEEIVKTVRRLQDMGADILIMPCHTAHYYYDEVLPYATVPFLNMPRETARFLRQAGIGKVGVLSTMGTHVGAVYDKALQQEGIESLYLSDEKQEIITSLIYDYVKFGRTDYTSLPIEQAVDELKEQGAQKIILACTELPIAFERLNLTEDTVNPTEILAKAALRSIGAPVK